jgi:HEAT repeat protein
MTPQDIETLIHHLQGENVQERQQAAIELSRLKNDYLIDPLLDALHDSDSTVRANIAIGLGFNKAQDAVEPLITLLKDREDIVRERAASALAQIGDMRAIEPLIDALDDSGIWAKNRIIYVLGASKAVQAVEPLIVLLDSDDISTQGVAAWALGAIGDLRAFDPLLGLLDDPNYSVRGNAAFAMGELGQEESIPHLIELLKDSSPEVRGKTAWALGNLGEMTGNTMMLDALYPLLEDYGEIVNESEHLFVCQYAAEALSQIGTDQALAAVEAWKPFAREKLLPRRIQDLIRALQHRDLETRERIFQELQAIGSQTVEPLIEALGTHENIRVRQGAAQALGLLDDKRAVNPLMMALNDPDSGVWSQATAALGKMGENAEKLLRKYLYDKKNGLRFGSAIALWRIKGEEKAFTTVLQAIQHQDVVIRGSAITSLWMQPDERAVATLQIQLQKEETGGMMAKYILHALETIGSSMATATVANYLAENRERL